MSEIPELPPPDEVLAEFTAQLLGCGAVLSQVISQMVQFERAAGPTPNAVPIPEVAHKLVASVLVNLRRRYSRRDLKTAAAILGEATDTICEEIFFIPFDQLEALGADRDTGGAGE